MYGGYHAPISPATSEKITGTEIAAPINPKMQITVIAVGRLLFLSILQIPDTCRAQLLKSHVLLILF